MKYVNEYRSNEYVQKLVQAIRLATSRNWHIMEICGGQTHAIAKYRIEDLLPANITLLHGPGCPVCVTPTHIIDAALQIARLPDVIFTSFGDMMRVPGSKDDLLQAKAEGADIRMLHSPLDAIELAANNLDKEVVFFAIGFETTTPVHTMAVREAKRRQLKNFSILTSLFTVPPAIEAILSDPHNKVDGFLTAGHVCAVVGNEPYHKLARTYHKPMVVTGFEPADILYGIYKCVLQLEKGEAKAENAYKRIVTESGNLQIQQLIAETLTPFDQEWRGIGIIPNSGLQLNTDYRLFDAMYKFADRIKNEQMAYDNSGEQLLECIAGEIMKGNKQAADCIHFGKSCKPQHPIGAPMVSTEGVCAAYYNYK